MTIFNRDKVTSVYSGRHGCACGCKGKYSYAAKHADKRPDYYQGAEAINDRVVTSVVNRIEKMMIDPNSDIARVSVHDDSISVDMRNDRTYTIYFHGGE
jgi:hypothetical protein